ncbi:cysteine hydrolase family protein [Sporolactobacillus spathodeae]|uniref:Nicotinamidase-related amidase n=1 Tax=Sporolactobacillus spathodeae TaxID=1465502 RepID=A0ABS2Q7Z1_9BACL|nr:isochorismatase family cysteine hydrolase [Sporolactobacillus spathodeae]MBM7657868.1 nicotinamidase-related amidase [Sporolactobacillus spathodeae]
MAEEKEALLVIDMSNDFVADKGGLTAGKAAQQIVPYLCDLVDQFHNEGKLIIFCMDAHETNDPHFKLWPPHNIKGSWGAELWGPLGEWYKQHHSEPNVLFLPKPEYDAFIGTNLDQILRVHHVTAVHLTGVCTDICDFLTAYGAYSRGYRTIAHATGMATFTGQHELFLKQMAAIFKTEIVHSDDGRISE